MPNYNWKLPKMYYENFLFPSIFVPLKLTCLVSLFDRKNSANWKVFGIFNEFMYTQNVKCCKAFWHENSNSKNKTFLFHRKKCQFFFKCLICTKEQKLNKIDVAAAHASSTSSRTSKMAYQNILQKWLELANVLFDAFGCIRSVSCKKHHQLC